jgi:hypothetical protein
VFRGHTPAPFFGGRPSVPRYLVETRPNPGVRLAAIRISLEFRPVKVKVMATFDYEALQLMQIVYDDVVAKVSARYATGSVHDTIARSINAIAPQGVSDAEELEIYARTKAITALAGLTP